MAEVCAFPEKPAPCGDCTLCKLSRAIKERDEALLRGAQYLDEVTAINEDVSGIVRDAEARAKAAEASRDEARAQVEQLVGDVRAISADYTDAKASADEAVGLLRETMPIVREYAEPEASYGAGGGVDDPHDFTPDPEASTEAERQAHRLACEAWDRGEPVGKAGRGCAIGPDVIACSAAWGYGICVMHNRVAESFRDRLHAFLAKHPEAE